MKMPDGKFVNDFFGKLCDDDDLVGNRLTKTDDGVTMNYTYDDNDRLMNEGGFTYTYDNNGNMVTKTGNGEDWQLAYNAPNQLTQATLNVTSVAYQYDSSTALTDHHDGIRVGKTVNDANVTKYIIDKNVSYAQVLEEQWTRGGQRGVTRYTYGDALIAQTTSGVSQFYQYDGLGSTRGLTDATSAMTGAYAYDAYGQLLKQTGASANPYLYRGEQYDPETEAYYLRARYYQPGIERFLTTDLVVKETYRGKHRHDQKVWTVVAALVNLRYAAEPHHDKN